MNTQKRIPLIKTRIQHVQEKFVSNQLFIQKVANLTKLDYEMLVYDTGMAFLENMYPPKTVYDEYLMTHAKSPRFWNWFKSEWNVFEQRFLKDYSLSDIKITSENYQERMSRIINNKFVDRAFHHNYLRK